MHKHIPDGLFPDLDGLVADSDGVPGFLYLSIHNGDTEGVCALDTAGAIALAGVLAAFLRGTP